mmetsp:Transcript_19216/g.21973  ORF Transcript_19216/g.21973 Transcript_19216/m.21973 type:complete len:407 (+) Transcript_19216:57-1277(+)
MNKLDEITPLVGNSSNNTRQRRTAGKNDIIPYSDDPFAEIPVILGSSSFEDVNNNKEVDKKKCLPIRKRVLNGCCWSFRACGCCDNNNNILKKDNRYYRDDFNDSPWSCQFGTTEEDGIWMNTSDQAGTIMSMFVWLLLGYSSVTMTFLAYRGGISITSAMCYCLNCSLSLASHAKTTLTDPGAIPASAVPTEEQRKCVKLSMCSQCQTFKPPYSHHCRICNRCVSRMDHHCPWMNNCIGAGNFKHFLLFLIYTWSCSVGALGLLTWNYFYCAKEDCTFPIVLVQLVRVMTVLSVCTFLFTSSMLMNVVYGIMTGIGTIDRLKKKSTMTLSQSTEESIPMKNIFGVGPLYTWFLPIDPIFEDYDKVLGYSTPQRLLREQMMKESPNVYENKDNDYPPSVISQYIQV